MARVYANANGAAAKHVETKAALRRENRMLAGRARSNLAAANTTSRITAEGYFPAEIETAEDGTDMFTILHAPNAMALEFGHSPSGFFAGTDTKSPGPAHILTRAAYGSAT